MHEILVREVTIMTFMPILGIPDDLDMLRMI